MPVFGSVLGTREQLAERYRAPHELVARKKIDHVDDGAAALIAASPFVLVDRRGALRRAPPLPRAGRCSAPCAATRRHSERRVAR